MTWTGSVSTTWLGNNPQKMNTRIGMPRYPFDTQACAMVLQCEGNSGEFVQLVVEQLDYLGPKDLTQYFIRSISSRKAFLNLLEIRCPIRTRERTNAHLGSHSREQTPKVAI